MTELTRKKEKTTGHHPQGEMGRMGRDERWPQIERRRSKADVGQMRRTPS